eukprot:s323_g2.t1
MASRIPVREGKESDCRSAAWVCEFCSFYVLVDIGVVKLRRLVRVVCATCIGCGMGPLDKIKFPFIVIDEAAQVIEPATQLPSNLQRS